MHVALCKLGAFVRRPCYRLTNDAFNGILSRRGGRVSVSDSSSHLYLSLSFSPADWPANTGQIKAASLYRSSIYRVGQIDDRRKENEILLKFGTFNLRIL